MVRKWTLILLLALTNYTVLGQEENKRLVLASEMNVGLLHLGSYIKERPIFYLNQELTYQLKPRFAPGILSLIHI